MDLRVKQIVDDFKKSDNSFKDRPNGLAAIFGKNHYTESEARDIWHRGIEAGVEMGLFNASLEGQRIELAQNLNSPKQKEFVEKLYKLCEEYNCAVQYHPINGMCLVEKP
jgi:hypothetical protein